MPIVYQLLRSLNEQEVERISGMPMQDRERDVLTAMLQINNRIFPSSTICKKLNLQSSHLDKINSILFKKIMEELVGNDIFKQIQYLDQKSSLWNVSKRVLNFYELKIIRHSTDKAEKFKFYSFYFQWLITIPVTLRSEAELNKLAQHILENCPKETYDVTELWIDITQLRKEINASISSASFQQESVQKTIIEKIDNLIARAAAIDSPQNAYKARLAAVVFYNLIQNFSKSRIYITEINDLLLRHADDFTDMDITVAQWHYAQTLFYSSHFEEAYSIYKSIIGKINLKELARWYVLVAEYFQVCIIQQDFEQATGLCENFFSKFFKDVNASFYLSSMIQCTKLLLHTGEYEDARIKLDVLQRHTSKTASLQFQFALRELTVAWYYLNGKYEKALVLAEKNLKYMRSKKIHHLIPEYTFHSRLTKSIIRLKTKNIPLDNDDKYMLDIMQQGTMKQYGMFLNKLLA